MQPRDWDETRAAFDEAAVWFTELVPDDTYAWGTVALGDWSVRDLVGHASRALITTEQYLDRPASSIDLETPASYYPAVFASVGDPAAVSARGRAAGQALGPHPAFEFSKLVARTIRIVEGATPDAPVGTPVGGMRLVDYLTTRTFELVVHGCDLAVATGRPVEVPDVAADDSLRLLTELAVAKGVAGRLLLAGTGRPLPLEGLTVL